MDAGEGADNMVQASKAVGAGIISATCPLVVNSDTIARWDGSVFELSTEKPQLSPAALGVKLRE